MWKHLVRLAILVTVIAACNVESATFTPWDSEGFVVDLPPDIAVPQRLIVSESALSVSEGAQTSFTVALAAQPMGNLTVSISSSDEDTVLATPPMLTFGASDFSTPKTVTVSGREDVDVADEAETVMVSATGLTTESIAITVDDNDGLGVIATPAAGLEVTEGGTTTLGVRLNAQPTAPTMVTIASGNTALATVAPATLTFTAANWDVEQAVIVSGVDDSGTSSDSTTLLVGGALLSQVSVPLLVVDDDILGIAPSTTNLGTLREGGSASFTVTLTEPPTGDVTVTVVSSHPALISVAPGSLVFTPNSWNTAQTISVNAPDDIDIADGTATISLTATGLTTRNVAATVDDDDAQAVIAFPVPVNVDEGGVRDVNVRLGYQPSGDVTLTVSSLNEAAATALPASLTFTPANYDTNQLVTVTALEDIDAAGGQTALRLESASLGLLTDIPVAITDDDQLTIETSTTAVTVGEAGTMQFGVRLTAMPVITTVVNVSSGDPSSATAAPTALSFTTGNWNNYQMVTVSGVDDLDLDNELVSVTLAAAGLPAKTVDITVSDDDMQAVLMSSANVSVNEGGTATVGVTLRYMPTANVNVAVAVADTGVATAAPATLTFTPANYNLPQQITAAGVSDADATDETTTITATAAGATTGTVGITVQDDDALGIATSVTTLTVDEGDTTTLGLRLTAQPTADTVITVASGDSAVGVTPTTLTFTSVNWNTEQFITVAGNQDLDAANESVTLSASSPGLTTRNVTVSVTDDDPLLLALTTSSVMIGEGNTGTFGVHLTAEPSSDITVTVTSSDLSSATATPATLTFTPANYAVDQTVTVTGVQDVDVANEITTVTLAASGVPSAPVTVGITDDDTQAVIASASTVNVTENGTATIGLSLQYAPAANVTVTVGVASGAIATADPPSVVFTPANYASPQTVTISGTDDVDAVDATTTLAATAPGATSASVGIQVTDDDELELEISTTAMTVVEGTPSTFGVRLTAAPSAPLTVMVASSDTTAASVTPTSLTFSAANWNQFQQVTVAGTSDADAAGEAATVSLSSPGLMTRTISVTVTDDEVQGIVVDATMVSLGEGGMATFGVRLAAQPLADRTVTVMSGDPDAATAAPTTLTFTPANYNTLQTVTVAGVADVDLANESVTISLQSAGVPTVTVTADVTDDDTQLVEVDQSSVTLGEGTTATVGVRLAFQPAGNVTVTLSTVSAAVATVSPTTLTFNATNYGIYQNVTIGAPHDTDLAPGATTLEATAPSATPASVAVTVTDDDTQAVVVTPTTLSITEGGTGTFAVSLAFAPSANVTVNVSSANTAVATVSPATLTFTPANYASAQTVTVTAPQDQDIAGNATTITATTAGAASGTVNISVADNDTQAIQVTPSSLTVVEGASGTFGVTLGFIPSGNVTVTVSSGSAAVATAAPTTLTFTPANYNVSQTVMVTGSQDANLIANTTTVTAAAAGATSGVVNVTANDDDTQVVQVSSPTVSVTEGATTTFGVTLGFVPTGNVTVSLASSDTTVVGVGPPTLTFTPANYNVSQSVTVSGVDDLDLAPETATVSATAAGATAGSVSVSVTDNDSQAVLVSPSTVAVTEGSSGSFGVTLAFQPSANVTVTMTATDPTVASLSPATLTFTPANYNASQSVTVNALHDVNLVAGMTSITATAPSSTPGSVTVNVTDDDTQIVQFSTATVSVTEGSTATLGVKLGFAPASNLTVTIGSNNSAVATVAPTTLTFTPANYDTFQNVVITGAQDANTSTDTATITATAPGATSASATASVSDDDIQRAVVSPSALSLTEGGTTNFGVTLAFAPASNITVNVASADTSVATVSASTLTFTPANYNVSQTVSVTAIHDGDLAAESTTITVGGGGAQDGTVVVDVVDDDIQAVQVSPSSLSMTEGGSSGFGVTLAFQPSANVTVNVSSANSSVATVSLSTLTFTPANYNVSQNVVVTAPQDLDLIANSTTLTASATGATPATVGVNVSDNDTQIVQLAPSTLSISEGASGSISVTLGFIPSANVTVTLSSDNTTAASVSGPGTLTFTPANYNVPQTVTVFGEQDLNLVSNSANITGTAAGASSTSTAVTVTDDDTQRVVMDASTSIAEGETQFFGIRLAYQPSSNVTVTLSSSNSSQVSVSPTTLTFTPANYNVDQTYSLTAQQDVDLVGTTVTITGTAPGALSGQLSASVTDDDTQVVVVSPISLTIAEGSSSTFTVALAFQPSANVTVSIASGNTGVATVGPGTVTFTPANYSTAQTVTVTAPQDIDLVNNATTITATAPGASSGVVAVTNTDNDTQVVSLTSSSVTLTEGGSTTIGVTLGFVPPSNVTVTLASNNGAVASVSPTTMTFTPTNWNVSQSMVIGAPHDLDLIPGSATITASAAAATSGTVSVNVNDDDTQRVVFTPTSMSVTEGSAGSLAVRLDFIPTSNVTVNLTSASTTVATVSPASVTFTPANYATSQLVTVTAVQDVNLVVNSTTITGAATGAISATLNFTSTDDDVQVINTLGVASIINEGGSDLITVALGFQPSANVTVSLFSSDSTALAVSPTSLTFTPSNYATQQTVTISGVNDSDAANEVVTITLSTSGASNSVHNITQRDNDLISVNPTSMGIPCTSTSSISVVLAGPPLENMTIGVTASGVVTASPSTLSFTPLNWNTPKSVIVDPFNDGTGQVQFSAANQTTVVVPVTSIWFIGC